mgnify:CR=1 FL=1
MGFNVFTEIFRLGAVLSFLAVMTDPESLFKNPVMQPVLTLFNITSPEGMLLPLTLTLGVAAVMAATMRLVQAWANMRVSFATGAELSISVYRRTLYQPYSVHVSRNSSTIINAVSSKTVSVISGPVIPAVNALISTVILLSIIFIQFYCFFWFYKAQADAEIAAHRNIIKCCINPAFTVF